MGNIGRAIRTRTERVYLLLLLLAALLLVACQHNVVDSPPPSDSVATVSATPTTAAAAAPTHFLATGLQWLPPDGLFNVRYTDWDAVKRWYGADGMNSATVALPARIHFMAEVTGNDHAPALVDGMFFPYMVEQWGWDSTDLVWGIEARTTDVTTSLHILQLRADFDLDLLRAHLQAANFIVSEHRGVEIHHMPLTETPAWHFSSPLEIHTVAIDAASRQLILSPRLSRVKAAIDASFSSTSLADDPTAAQLLDALADTSAGVLYVGERSCEQFGPNAGAPSQPYAALGTGYAVLSNGEQLDVLAFAYPSSQSALADTSQRTALFASERSWRYDTTYAAQFAITPASQRDQVVRFELTPTSSLEASLGMPKQLAGWFLARDALFARCTA